MHERVSSEMIHVAEWMLIRILDTGYRILRPIVHLLFTIVYYRWTGRTVPPVRNPILKMSATELAKQIREGKLRSETVVRSFVDRIVEVEPFINATVECRFLDALKEAQKVDALILHSDVQEKERLAKEKPLLGVPITIKVILTVKGMRCTAGSLVFQDTKAQEDATAVALLKEAGAIVLATTNSAEFGMGYETSNFAHGTTCNPYDISKISGGSSGGEGALLGSAGSVIGLGNDLGGSIRVPSYFNGIFGHKASRGLVSNIGCFPVIPEKASSFISTGPLCRYAKDLEITMKVLSLGSYQPLNLKEDELRKIKVYYMYSFGKMPFASNPEPEIQDAVKKVVSYFEIKHGSISKQANIPLLKSSTEIFFLTLMSSVSNTKKILLAGKSDFSEKLELLKMIFRKSKFTIGPNVALNFSRFPLIYNFKKAEHFKKLGKELENQLNMLLDNNSILVLPTFPFAAPYHKEILLLLGNTGYTSIFNILGVPVTQCPVTLNKRGLPIGVQIVGRHGNDALTIACSIELEKAFGGWIPPK